MQGGIDYLRVAHDVKPVIQNELVGQRVAIHQHGGGQQESDEESFFHADLSSREERRDRRFYLEL